MTQLYTLARAAELLDVHLQQVRELIWSDQIEWVNVAVGKRPRPRIPDYAIEKFIKARSSKTRRTQKAVA
jgi:hypothetical protein